MSDIYVFDGGNDTYGFCKSKEGKELPKELNGIKVSWEYFKTLQEQEPTKNRIAVNVQEMKASIEKNGYYISGAAIVSKILEE